MNTKLSVLLIVFTLVSITLPAEAQTTVNNGFVYSNGNVSLIPNPPNTGPPGTGTVNVTQGINNSGQVVGYGALNGLGGFIYSGGSYTYLSAPGAAPDETLAHGINDHGQVVGTYYTGTGSNFESGFRYSGGSYTTINDPLANQGTGAMGINNAGQIVGYYLSTACNYPGCSGAQHFGFLYSGGTGGTYTTISYPGAMDTILYGINNSGLILGAYEMQGLPPIPGSSGPPGSAKSNIIRGKMTTSCSTIGPVTLRTCPRSMRLLASQ
jgi:hypothetical protein